MVKRDSVSFSKKNGKSVLKRTVVLSDNSLVVELISFYKAIEFTEAMKMLKSWKDLQCIPVDFPVKINVNGVNHQILRKLLAFPAIC